MSTRNLWITGMNEHFEGGAATGPSLDGAKERWVNEHPILKEQP